MPGSSPKAEVLRDLRAAGETVTWKLDGRSEDDTRRAMVPTGNSPLGPIKHLSSVESVGDEHLPPGYQAWWDGVRARRGRAALVASAGA